jgi:hypothetical protein
VATSAVGAATNGDKSTNGQGGASSGGLCLIRGFVVHVLCQVSDDGHYLVSGEEVVGVERVDDTLFCLSKMASAGDAAEHEESQVVRMDGCRAIDHFARPVVVVKVLTHEVGVLYMGLFRALTEHQGVQE